MKTRNEYDLFKKFALISSKLKGMKDKHIPVITPKESTNCTYEVVLLGSKAFSVHAFNPRAEHDIDVIGPMDNLVCFANEAFPVKYSHCQVNEMSISFHGSLIMECQPVFDDEETTSNQLWDMRDKFISIKIGKFTVYVPDLKTLYMIKLSHRYKPGFHFMKTMLDIKYMRQIMDANGIDYKDVDSDFIKQRREEYSNKKDYKLNVSKGEFFTSNFNYVYDHDTIHIAVALDGAPAYTKYTSEEVYSSKDLFFAGDEQTRINGVLEECYTLAIERVYVPNMNNKSFTFNPRNAFEIALQKVCTTITGGWFREYAWENYDLILSQFDASYIDKFKKALDNNEIAMYKPVEEKA